MAHLVQLKERMKSFWALGNYPEVAKRFEGAADALVAACDIAPGDRVLDVAAGNGNVAVAAARLGARVTASDFAPSLVAAGRARTEALGLDVRWDEADAEALPYADGRFDAVTSAFGLMFAPRPEVAAAEAFRVVRPGGVVGLTAWTPDGFTGQVTALMGEYTDAVRLTRGTVLWEFRSLSETLRWQEANFGAMIAARAAVGERYAELRTRLTELIREWNRGGDHGVRLPASYLLVVARRDR
jgi:SAM-dependent methyltransferase